MTNAARGARTIRQSWLVRGEGVWVEGAGEHFIRALEVLGFQRDTVAVCGICFDS